MNHARNSGAVRELDKTQEGGTLPEGQGSPDVRINDRGAWRENISRVRYEPKQEAVVRAGVAEIYINDERAVRRLNMLIPSWELAVSNEGEVIDTGSEDVFFGERDFGLSVRKAYCAKFKKFRSAWAGLKPKERAQSLTAFVQDLARERNVPPPTVSFPPDRPGEMGAFDWVAWDMILPKGMLAHLGTANLFAASKMPDKSWYELSGTLVHEMRHLEFAFLGLRKVLDLELTERNKLQFYKFVVRVPPTVLRATTPLEPGSPEDITGVAAMYDYLDAKDWGSKYADSPGGLDAAHYEYKVGCCTGE